MKAVDLVGDLGLKLGGPLLLCVHVLGLAYDVEPCAAKLTFWIRGAGKDREKEREYKCTEFHISCRNTWSPTTAGNPGDIWQTTP